MDSAEWTPGDRIRYREAKIGINENIHVNEEYFMGYCGCRGAVWDVFLAFSCCSLVWCERLCTRKLSVC